MEKAGGTEDVKSFEKATYSIPSSYGDNKIVLMVRDPWTVYSYWEISQDREDSVRSEIFDKAKKPARSVLRAYKADGAETAEGLDTAFEFELRDWANSWYIHTGAPGTEWIAEVGILCEDGDFFPLVTSNKVKTPYDGMSDEYDGEWMCPEDLYLKMLGAAGGFDPGSSSLELRELMEKHLRNWISSGAVTSGMFGSENMFNIGASPSAGARC